MVKYKQTAAHPSIIDIGRQAGKFNWKKKRVSTRFVFF